MKRTIEDDAAKLCGTAPYNTPMNLCFGDGYFDNDCRRHWGDKAWEDACKRARRLSDWHRGNWAGTTTDRLSSHTAQFAEVGMQRAKRLGDADTLIDADYSSLEERYWATASPEQVSAALAGLKAQWDNLTQRCPWDNFKPSKDIA